MTKVSKIMRVECFVVNDTKNDEFENVLEMLMVPVRCYDENSNTYVINVTYKLWSYIQRECRFREIDVLPQDGFRKAVVNAEAYEEYREQKKRAKQALRMAV